MQLRDFFNLHDAIEGFFSLYDAIEGFFSMHDAIEGFIETIDEMRDLYSYVLFTSILLLHSLWWQIFIT